MTEHTNQLIGKAGQNLYALKILKAHGLSQNNLANVTIKATLISRLHMLRQLGLVLPMLKICLGSNPC